MKYLLKSWSFRNNIFFTLGLIISFHVSLPAQIANYVSNGGFEQHYTCSTTGANDTRITNAVDWDEIKIGAVKYCQTCQGSAPYCGFTFQNARSGAGYVIGGLFIRNDPSNYSRNYFRNKLKTKLVQGQTYCVTFYVNLSDYTNCAIDRYQAYFGDESLDTIQYAQDRLTYLTPQMKNPTGNIVGDTLNWTPITGTFTAAGTEKYMVIGNFETDANTNFNMLEAATGQTFNVVSVDDVSCIPINLPAFAGHDTTCISGTSVYIGRPQDTGIDEDCKWYKLPLVITPTTPAIDTAAGIWVSPTATSTYVVRQEICGFVRWDTVVVYKDYVGLEKITADRSAIKLYPNPANETLNVDYTSAKQEEVFKFIIMNRFGQIVREAEITFKEHHVNLNVKDLINGIYFVQIINKENEIVTKKLVITR